MKTASVSQRIKESISGCIDLSKMLSVIKEHQHNPLKFWGKYQTTICTGIQERYVIIKQPDIEVLIPIHHNMSDLPLLFYGLSQQQINQNYRVGLTVVMHNNKDIRKWNMYDDGSWKIIKELLIKNVPIKILTLTDPLLTGPYMAWQYLIAKSTGKKIAILDADCLPPSQWLSRITKLLDENHRIRFTGGIRIDMVNLFPFNITTRFNYIRTILKNIISPYKPNLPHMKAFQGGQAAYNRKLIDSTFNKFLGNPEGDSIFAQIMLKKYGDDCFAFADAPVFCKITHPKKISKDSIISKTQRIIWKYIPKNLAAKLPKIQPRFNITLYYIYLYSFWFRPFIDRYTKNGSLTHQEIAEIFIQTAIYQKFDSNPYVRRFIKYLERDNFNVNNNQQLFQLYFGIARNCHRPTLINHLIS